MGGEGLGVGSGELKEIKVVGVGSGMSRDSELGTRNVNIEEVENASVTLKVCVGEGDNGILHSSPVYSGRQEQLKSSPRSVQLPLPLQFMKSQIDIGGEGLGVAVGEINIVDDKEGDKVRGVSHSSPVNPGKQEQLKSSPRSTHSPFPLQFTKSQIDRGISQNSPVHPAKH